MPTLLVSLGNSPAVVPEAFLLPGVEFTAVHVLTTDSSLDTTTPPHHGEIMNRLTITLDDDLYAMARAYAVANRKSISKAIGELMRQGRGTPVNSPTLHPETTFQIDPVTQLPVVRGRTERITMEDVRLAVEDDDIRHLEAMGLSPEEIERSLAR